jgi:hypothetical protein
MVLWWLRSVTYYMVLPILTGSCVRTNKVALFNWNVGLFALLNGIATGLGMQWTMGAINVFFLWIFGVPVTYYSALVRGGGLASVWTWINAPYACMNVSLIVIFIVMDWQKVQTKIQDREEVEASIDFEVQRRTINGVEKETVGLLNGGNASAPRRYDYGGAGQ